MLNAASDGCAVAEKYAVGDEHTARNHVEIGNQNAVSLESGIADENSGAVNLLILGDQRTCPWHSPGRQQFPGPTRRWCHQLLTGAMGPQM